jgi:hypothetical protein
MPPLRITWLATLTFALAVGCGGPTAPASFDPAQPCNGADEQRMAGAYPELEGAVPPALAGQAATARESGRYCSPKTLGNLAEAGVTEAHYGAATWDHGGGKAVSLVMFEAVGLTDQVVYDSYLAGAQANSKIHDMKTSSPTIAGQPAHRMDFLNGESSFQRILVWPGDRPGRVRVLLAADLVDAEIQAAADAFR